MNKHYWSEADVHFLRQNYSKCGIRFCSGALNRSIESTRKKAHRLGLKAPGSKVRTTQEYADELFNAGRTLWPIGDYVNANTALLHGCLCGNEWNTKPTHVLAGSGCPTCAISGFDPTKPAILYYIKITQDNLEYYKIGITNKTVAERFYRDRDKNITIIEETSYIVGAEAQRIEQVLLSKYEHARQNISGWLKSGGNTELFEYDVLGLDYKIEKPAIN